MFIVLLNYYNYETTYDSFLKNYKKIFAVRSVVTGENSVKRVNTVPPGVGPHLLEYPEVKNMVRMVKGDDIPLQYKDLLLNNNINFFVDSTFFTVFSFPFIVGNAKDAFKNPNSVVLTESAAKKFFRSKNGIGEIIKGRSIFGDSIAVEVTGIIKDLPPNSHFKFDILFSMDVRYRWKIWGFIGGGKKLDDIFYFGSDKTYIVLNDNSNIKTLEGKIDEFTDKYIITQKKNKNKFANERWKIIFQPLEKVHLYSDYDTDEDFIKETNNAKTVTFLSAFILFVLFFSLLNYSNYFILNTINKKKNFIIRYIFGENKVSVILYFIIKNLVINLLAIIVSIILLAILSPLLENLFKISIIFNPQFYRLIYTSSLLILIIILIPSFLSFLFLSYFKYLNNKDLNRNNKRLFSIWNLSFIFQFSLAVIIIIATIIVQFQYNYILKKDLGIDTKNILVLTTLANDPVAYKSFKNELLRNPAIESVSGNRYRIGDKIRNLKNFKINSTGDIVNGEKNKVDPDFLKTFNIRLAAGRYLNQDDGWKVLINETAVKEWGFGSDKKALHEYLTITNSGAVVEIVGVFKDFHQRSLKNKIKAQAIISVSPFKTTVIHIYVKINPKDIKGTISYIKDTWGNFYPPSLFQYQFVDQIIKKINEDTIALMNLLRLLLIVTIICVCFGIFSISSFTVKRKMHEAAVRKVCGASNSQIFKLISISYIWNIFISLIISVPIAYYIANQIIANYEYKIDFPIKAFFYAFFVLLFIVFITIGSLITRISKANPVEVLKEE